MKKTFSKILAVALMIAGLAVPALSASAYAADPICDNKDLTKEMRAAMGCDTNPAQANQQFKDTAIGIINGILGVIGLVAVVFVIYGGFLYLTSAGDPGKVKKGKDAIVYALIGLVIVGLAFAIVNFVIADIIQ